MAISEFIKNTMLLGLGVQEKVKDFVDELVKKGKLSESEGAKFVKEWVDKAEKNTEDITTSMSDLMQKAIDRMKLPSKEDIDKINEQIAELSEKIKKLEETKG